MNMKGVSLRKPLSLMMTAFLMCGLFFAGVTDVWASNWNMKNFLKTYSDSHFNLSVEPDRAMTVEEFIAVVYAYSFYGKGSSSAPAADKNGKQPSAWCAKYVQAEVDKGTVKPSAVSWTDTATVAFAAEFLSRSKGKYNYDYNNLYSFTGTDGLSAESKMFLNVAVDYGLIPYSQGMNASQPILRKNARSYEVKSGQVSIKAPAQTKSGCMRDVAVFFPDTYWDYGKTESQLNDLKNQADTVSMVTFACSYVYDNRESPGYTYLKCDLDHGQTVNDYNGRSSDPQLDAIQWCKNSHKLALMGVCNADTVQKVKTVFSSTSAADTLLNEIMTSVDKYGMDGVNMDLELSAADGGSLRNAYSAFLSRLASRLHSEGKVLMVSVGAFFTSDQEAASIYDYAAIDKAADYVDVILYDDYPDTSYPYNHTSGNISNIVRIGRVMRYAGTVMDPTKLQLGVGGFAIDYDTTNYTASDIKYSYAQQLQSCNGLKIIEDTETAGGHYDYVYSGANHSVYLETESGLAARMALVNRYNFNGINVYYAGSGCSPVYNAANSNASYIKEVNSAVTAGLVPTELRNSYSSSITRGDFCKLITAFIEAASGESTADFLTEKGVSASSGFSDTSDASVKAASALGIVTGYEDHTFRPDKTITRKEAAAILQRLGDVMGCSGSGSVMTFSDTGSQQDWALKGINYVTSCTDPSSGSRVMNGTGNGKFSPDAGYTREQSMMTMIRLYHAVKA